MDFYLGYSPEKVNPGDKIHTIDKIDKVISGQNKKVEKSFERNLLKTYFQKKSFLRKILKLQRRQKLLKTRKETSTSHS